MSVAVSQAIDWSGIRAAAITFDSVNAAAIQAGANLPPDEAERLRQRINKRAMRERWMDVSKVARLSKPTNAKPLSNSVLSGSAAIRRTVESGTNLAILTLKEKREYLASVVRTPVGKVDQNSALAQKVKRSTRRDKDGTEFETEEIETPGKLRAIELDARLAGELDAAKSEGGLVMVHLVRIELPGSAGEKLADVREIEES